MPIRDLRRGAEGVRLSPLRPAAAADATFMALQPIPRKGAGRGEFKCPRPNPERGKRVTVAENLRVIDSGIDALNAHDWVRFVGLHAESITDVNPATPEPIRGRDALREYYEQFNRAFPDLRTRKDGSFGQGDWVCLETTSSGTHKGPLLGPGGHAIPATGNSFRMKVAGVFKLERRQITEVHEYFDLAGFMAQLGLGSK